METATATLELWLVRHGETTRSVARRVAGWSDPPLTPLGRREAAALANRLRDVDFDGVWASDLVRALETARLAWGEPVPDRRLRELNFGDLEGLPFAEVDEAAREAVLAFREFAAPGGESLEDLERRLASFLADLPPGRHLLFVHGGVIRALTRRLGLDRFVPTGTLVAVDWTRRELLFVEEPPGARPVFDETRA